MFLLLFGLAGPGSRLPGPSVNNCMRAQRAADIALSVHQIVTNIHMIHVSC